MARPAGHFHRALRDPPTLGSALRFSVTQRVWHLLADRADLRALDATIEAGAWEPPPHADALPEVGDYLFVRADRLLAVGRVLDARGRRFAVRWARLPLTADLRGVPRRGGLVVARAFAWEQRQLADRLLGRP